MNPIPLPWMILGFLLAVGGAGAAGYIKGGKDTGNRIATDLALTAEATRKAQGEALQAAAESIAKIDVKTTTIRQKTEVITREVPVYGTCRHSADGLRNVNEALTGTESPASDGKLPAPDPASR
jgi:hypothetical protein